MEINIKRYFHVIAKFSWGVIDSVRCLWLVGKMRKPIVSIFGGKYAKGDADYTEKAFEISKKLVENDMSILTGGGPGVMKAANKGASTRKDGLWSVGAVVVGMPEDLNSYSQKHIRLRSLPARKWLLFFNSKAYVFFPGGYGTMDEFFNVLMFTQINYIKRRPIVLIGKDYWEPMENWITEKIYESGLVASHETVDFLITDDVDEALSYIKDFKN